MFGLGPFDVIVALFVGVGCCLFVLFCCCAVVCLCIMFWGMPVAVCLDVL